MKKYNNPTIKITSFLLENVVTEASGVIQSHIAEVDTLIGNMTQEDYIVRVESVNNLLRFTTE